MTGHIGIAVVTNLTKKRNYFLPEAGTFGKSGVHGMRLELYTVSFVNRH
jgi:hypothetical protein